MNPSAFLKVEQSRRKLLTDHLIVDESVLILGDVEIPFHNAEHINKCIHIAKQRGIKRLVLAGDFFHFEAFSFFPGGDKDAEKELAEIESYVTPFIKDFDEIYFVPGNHDRRLSRLMDRFLPTERTAKLIIPYELAEEFGRKVRFTDHQYLQVGIGAHKWRIVHPKATSAVPAAATRKIAENNDCNVIMAHNHLLGMQQTGDGRHVAIEIGCSVDYNRLGYYMTQDTTRPKMTTGAVLLERNYNGDFVPTILSPLVFGYGGLDEADGKETHKSVERDNEQPSGNRDRGRNVARVLRKRKGQTKPTGGTQVDRRTGKGGTHRKGRAS